MNAAILIREFADAGIQLSARGDRLRYEAPAGALTPTLRQRLLDYKHELMAALRLHAVGGSGRTMADILREHGLEPQTAPRIVCEYRLNANPAQWLIVLGAPGEAFDHIRHDLHVKYDGRLLQVRQHVVRKPG